jgi:hypothetical protein
MVSQVLFIIGASVFGLFGFIHLFYTFITNKFHAYDPVVTRAMKDTSPVITKETTIWRAWVGFNASHSLGMIYIAALYIPLSLFHFEFISDNHWFAVLPSIIGVSYIYLAKTYWFKIPFVGILLSTICFVFAFGLIN